ncbi:hypothetical protein RICGR_1023 [Rickettsiella grylli]|uniref:Uncharacterized protein n=1 Tax=Rickettsiella grylli TaxID=59196 RepID=A8PNJ5_9COXI|nr:hypothetical protein RICGR_1023 [Rickettsiella grylli]
MTIELLEAKLNIFAFSTFDSEYGSVIPKLTIGLCRGMMIALAHNA